MQIQNHEQQKQQQYAVGRGRSRVSATPTMMSGTFSNASKKKVLVLGGDGFCGWPTSLYLSEQGHDIIIVDNLSRRNIDIELGCSSLTPIESPEVRVKTWNQINGSNMRFINLDVAKEYDRLLQLLKDEKPDAVIHFAEQRAAPYSQKGDKQKRYTVDNNVSGTNNLAVAVIESELDIHIIHLGTMGVYGYGTSGGEIPEGYLDVTLPDGREQTILHPANPGSVYHTTKCLDALLFQFYNKNDQIRVTDLHQGIVWGTNTPQTRRDERLVNRFDYDGDYGTVLNRFIMQGSLGVPLTVYGTGGQTRGFIHVTDTAKCLEIALNNPPVAGEKVQIFNQIAETLRVRDVAQLVADKTGVNLNFIENPRQEAAENELEVSNRKFKGLGLDPILLDSNLGLIDDVNEIAKKYSDRCIREKILPSSFWNKKRATDCKDNKLLA